MVFLKHSDIYCWKLKIYFQTLFLTFLMTGYTGYINIKCCLPNCYIRFAQKSAKVFLFISKPYNYRAVISLKREQLLKIFMNLLEALAKIYLYFIIFSSCTYIEHRSTKLRTWCIFPICLKNEWIVVFSIFCKFHD